MSDLIKREDAIKAFEDVLDCDFSHVSEETPRERIEAIPSADRPQGEWKVRGNLKRNLWECSLCRCTIYSESESDRNEFHKWCGRCGAKMKGVDDE